MVKEHNGSFVIAVTLRDEENQCRGPAAEEWYAALFSGTSQTLSAICRLFQPRMTLQTTGVVFCRARTQLSCGASKRARRDRVQVLAMRGLRLSRTSVPEAMFAAVSLLFVLCSTSSIAHFLPFLTGALQLRYLSLFSLFCSGCPNTS